jgi:hypothetical protein
MIIMQRTRIATRIAMEVPVGFPAIENPLFVDFGFREAEEGCLTVEGWGIKIGERVF